MRLLTFSVTNYRSITTAHKINIGDFTVLVGKNNEGKSNLLTALNVAMDILIRHAQIENKKISYSRLSKIYDWERDFPIQLQHRKKGLESIFKLEFKLDDDELKEFQKYTKIRGNQDIVIEIKIDKENKIKISGLKRGTKSYTQNSKKVAEFISAKLSFNYIQAVRTETMAIGVLEDVIYQQLYSLNKNSEYMQAVNRINELEKEVLEQISKKLLEPLRLFLPNLRDVNIVKDNDVYRQIRYGGRNINVIIDDGIPTSISYKGDGIKSLATLAILKDRINFGGASIIAIEEPESHLHSGAIHNLIDVICKISENSQVIITTHNPLFVQRNKIKSNIIVDKGKATPAKNIKEIRDVLGVLPQDNLKNASYVLVVEGEDDKIILSKILSLKSALISSAITSNKLVIKPLGGASNLAHDILDLKNSMCKFFVLLDNDKAGNYALDVAKSKSLITEADYKLTICNGSPESEMEDCIKKEVYEEVLLRDFKINLNCKEFKNNKKWSDRIKDTRLSSGGRWNDKIESEIKFKVAECVSRCNTIDEILITQKSRFIDGLVESIERMLEIQ